MKPYSKQLLKHFAENDGTLLPWAIQSQQTIKPHSGIATLPGGGSMRWSMEIGRLLNEPLIYAWFEPPLVLPTGRTVTSATISTIGVWVLNLENNRFLGIEDVEGIELELPYGVYELQNDGGGSAASFMPITDTGPNTWGVFQQPRSHGQRTVGRGNTPGIAYSRQYRSGAAR